VADALGLDRFALFGHSLGGAIAQRFALAHPDRVRALVLSSSFAWVSTPRGAAVARWLEQPLVLAAVRLLPGAGRSTWHSHSRRAGAGCSIRRATSASARSSPTA
jgi:pimeloyl-ACP methyl ester carboxylesterase